MYTLYYCKIYVYRKIIVNNYVYCVNIKHVIEKIIVNDYVYCINI